MNTKDQYNTPLFNALQNHIAADIAPFHVPAHKHGNFLPELKEFFSENLLKADLNAMEDIDDLCNPRSVIKEAQNLAAELFEADHAFFLVNGTTSGIQAMMMAALKPNEKIILPRNSHKSVFSGLILSGARPIYIHPEVNYNLGITENVSVEKTVQKIQENPHAKAVLVVNPTYYGFSTEITNIVTEANSHDMLVIADEAHGGHFLFSEELPVSAMQAGADLAALSMHKTTGSFTQTSLLLYREKTIPYEDVVNALGLMRTTSASYILMTSLDVARRRMALQGRGLVKAVLELARYARKKINQIEGLYCYSPAEAEREKYYDITKLVIQVNDIGLTGYEAEMFLRNKYRVQIELSDMNNIVALVTVGDDQKNIEKLITALSQLALECKGRKRNIKTTMPQLPEVVLDPRSAFYGNKKKVKLNDARNEISAEMLMAYPPGIPVITPGERISQDIIDYINVLKEQNCALHGTADPTAEQIRVLGYL